MGVIRELEVYGMLGVEGVWGGIMNMESDGEGTPTRGHNFIYLI